MREVVSYKEFEENKVGRGEDGERSTPACLSFFLCFMSENENTKTTSPND